jgi:mycobactin lysine-N-oxygenase
MAVPRSRKRANTPRVAVIGGGAKGVALAAKATTLNNREAGPPPIELIIFEQYEVGANWSGRHGYTDGTQFLCTPAEKDLGFPYIPGHFGAGVQAAFKARFSWDTYKVSLSDPVGRYESWVNRGARPATHGEFAEYLQWVVNRCGAHVEVAKVEHLESLNNQWKITYLNRDGEHVTARGMFDAVVVTGPGECRPQLARPRGDARIYDGITFWQHLGRIRTELQVEDPDRHIIVIGGGGTGAAIIAWFARNSFGRRSIKLIADQATLFSRGDSVFENRLFTDPDTWRRLSPTNRKHFFNRLTRGVVWNSVMEDLTDATGLELLDNRAVGITVDKYGELYVSTNNWQGDTFRYPASLVVDASGFDPWWFLRLLDDWGSPGAYSDQLRTRLIDGMDETLAFTDGWAHPPLHAPFLASQVGPGFGTLLCLGDMADRVLGRYVPRVD